MKNLKNLFNLNTVSVGDFVKRENEIKDFEETWMNIDNPEKVKNFLEIAKNKFPKLKKIGDKVNIPFLISAKTETKIIASLIDATENLGRIDKYIAMIYFGLYTKMECPQKHREGNIKVVGSSRVSDWELSPKDVQMLIKAFSLKNVYRSWDGETALVTPLKSDFLEEKRNYDMNWDFKYDSINNWNRIIDFFLIRWGEEIPCFEVKSFLTEMLEKDKILNKIKKIKEFKKPSLLFLLSKKSIEIISQNPFSIKGNCIGCIQKYSGPHSERGWDVKIKSSVLRIFDLSSNTMFMKELSPYYEYEDIRGGKTTNTPRNEAVEIVNFSKEKFIVSMKDSSNRVFALSEVKNFKREKAIGFHESYQEDWARLTCEGDPSQLFKWDMKY